MSKMSEQLQFDEFKPVKELQMTAWYRRVGRKGVRNARLALSKTRPKAHFHRWRVTHTTQNGKLVSLRCRECPTVATAVIDIYPPVPTASTESRGLVQGRCGGTTYMIVDLTDKEYSDMPFGKFGPFDKEGADEFIAAFENDPLRRNSFMAVRAELCR